MLTVLKAATVAVAVIIGVVSTLQALIAVPSIIRECRQSWKVAALWLVVLTGAGAVGVLAAMGEVAGAIAVAVVAVAAFANVGRVAKW